MDIHAAPGAFVCWSQTVWFDERAFEVHTVYGWVHEVTPGNPYAREVITGNGVRHTVAACRLALV